MSIWISMHCSMSNWLVSYIYNIEMKLYAVWCGLHFTLWLPFFHLYKRCRRRWTPKKNTKPKSKYENEKCYLIYILTKRLLFHIHLDACVFMMLHKNSASTLFWKRKMQPLTICIKWITAGIFCQIKNEEKTMWMKRMRDC